MNQEKQKNKRTNNINTSDDDECKDKDENEVAIRDTKVAMTGRQDIIECIALGHMRYSLTPIIRQLVR